MCSVLQSNVCGVDVLKLFLAAKTSPMAKERFDNSEKRTKAETLKEVGLSPKNINLREAIASLPDEAFEKHIAEVKPMFLNFF